MRSRFVAGLHPSVGRKHGIVGREGPRSTAAEDPEFESSLQNQKYAYICHVTSHGHICADWGHAGVTLICSAAVHVSPWRGGRSSAHRRCRGKLRQWHCRLKEAIFATFLNSDICTFMWYAIYNYIYICHCIDIQHCKSLTCRSFTMFDLLKGPLKGPTKERSCGTLCFVRWLQRHRSFSRRVKADEPHSSVWPPSCIWHI